MIFMNTGDVHYLFKLDIEWMSSCLNWSVAQLVEHLVRDQGVARLNRVAPTRVFKQKVSINKAFEAFLILFYCQKIELTKNIFL